MATQRLKYIDDLKTLAIFGVIGIHIAILLIPHSIKGIPIYSFQEIVRFAVPVFLMVSGALLLNRKYEFKDFIKRKYVRLLLPLILWQILVIITDMLTGQWGAVTTFNILATPWYCWLMLGVYLAIPVLNEFIVNKGLEGAKYFIIIAILASILFQVLTTLKRYTYFDLRFFLGPVAFLMLGYYLANKDFKISNNKMILITSIVFVVFSVIKVLGIPGAYLTMPFTLTNRELYLSSNLNFSIFDIVHASALFLLVKALNESDLFDRIVNNKYWTKFSLSVSRASYGMYFAQDLIIFTILDVIFAQLHLTNFEAAILGLVSVFAVFILSWLMVLIISKIPYLKKWSGYA